ncbi:MAG: TIGR03862 family flavoprotein, partial [Planctomycetota bacterium]
MRLSAAVIGGGPAGLMAAEVLAERGVDTHVYEAMPIVGRKFLVAGHGGLNLTHTEPVEAFVARFGNRAGAMGRFLERFSPEDLRAWASGLGVETFVGTSGRVFPRELKASPLLRAWIQRLAERGVQLHTRERWHGFTQDGGLVFESGEVQPGAAVFALGGASYPKLGSDGGWVAKFEARGVPVRPLLASNCGFEVEWSEAFRDRAAGKPLKNLRLSCGGRTVDGELLLTGYGVEGGGVYALGPEIRAAIKKRGHAVLHLDLKRDVSLDDV